MKLVDSITKKKTQLQWFREGDTNSKYFHSFVRGRRRRLFTHIIINEDKKFLQGHDTIVQVACDHFQQIFLCEGKIVKENMLECILKMVSHDKNEKLIISLTMKKLKEAVFAMSPTYSACPDGMNSYFFKKCWHIIKYDLFESHYCLLQWSNDPQLLLPLMYCLGA